MHSKGTFAQESSSNTFVNLLYIQMGFSPGTMMRSVPKKPIHTMLLPNGPSSPAACSVDPAFSFDLE